jgi:hypothetical protein
MYTHISEIRTAFFIKEIIAMLKEAVRTFETSVYFNETTRRYVAEGYHVQSYQFFDLMLVK